MGSTESPIADINVLRSSLQFVCSCQVAAATKAVEEVIAAKTAVKTAKKASTEAQSKPERSAPPKASSPRVPEVTARDQAKNEVCHPPDFI